MQDVHIHIAEKKTFLNKLIYIVLDILKTGQTTSFSYELLFKFIYGLFIDEFFIFISNLNASWIIIYRKIIMCEILKVVEFVVKGLEKMNFGSYY